MLKNNTEQGQLSLYGLAPYSVIVFSPDDFRNFENAAAIQVHPGMAGDQ
jgi:hypothetical protein